MAHRPDEPGNLYDIVERIQSGDAMAQWDFTEHPKIQAIIKSRMASYRRMFAWLPGEDIEDVEFGLRPRLIEIAGQFELPVMRNEGRVVAYFNLRIKGEADHLLRRITGMKQMTNEDGSTFLKSLSQPLEGAEHHFPVVDDVGDRVVASIEDSRLATLLERVFGDIPDLSSDKLWLRCYLLRLAKRTWAQIAKEVGYRSTDHAFLKDNTLRFVNRLRDKLIHMGEQVSYRICGIYVDSGEVGFAIHDSEQRDPALVWSKVYESWADLDKIEAKLGDIFRQYDITYVVMNEKFGAADAEAIMMRYLHRRESFVETIDLRRMLFGLPLIPDRFGNTPCTQAMRLAYYITQVKRASLELNAGTPDGT